ncbi:MAG: hypothetical protein KIT56_09155 [Gammaproteobacteria bacterium]|nr:hypothetical protein [Gammaproteobacteria bacterium]
MNLIHQKKTQLPQSQLLFNNEVKVFFNNSNQIISEQDELKEIPVELMNSKFIRFMMKFSRNEYFQTIDEEQKFKLVYDLFFQNLTQEEIENEVKFLSEYGKENDSPNIEEVASSLQFNTFVMRFEKYEKYNDIASICNFYIHVLTNENSKTSSKYIDILSKNLIENRGNAHLINHILEAILRSFDFSNKLDSLQNNHSALVQFITIAALSLGNQSDTKKLIDQVINQFLQYQSKLASITYDYIKKRNEGDMDVSAALSIKSMLLYLSSEETITKLKKKYERVFQLTPVQHQISFDKLIKNNEYKIDMLLVIFDKKTPDVLALLLGTSLIGISRFFEMDFSNLKKYNYIKNLQLLEYKSAKDFFEIFQLLNVVPSENSYKHYKYISELLRSIKTKNLSSNDLIVALQSYFIDFFIKEMNLEISKDDLIQSNIYTPAELINLLNGYQKHKTNGYMPILHQILKCYLQSTKYPMSNFLWNKDQSDEFGKLIANNNFETRNELEKQGINPDIAFTFKYPYEHQFEVGAPEQVDVNQGVVTVWTGINELSSKLKILLNDENLKKFLVENGALKAIEKTNKQLINYISQIDKKRKDKDITVNNKDMINFIINQSNQKLLKDLMANLKLLHPVLEGLIQNQPSAKLQSVAEFNQHAIDYINGLDSALTKAKNTQKPEQITRQRKFRIVVWDKSDPKTLFLGNMLSCCLATDGAQFPAIIQRIIDCAMNMTVVIDEETKEPVSGMWLYFAKDVTTDKPYLVANFIEMRANIAQNKALLRDVILSQLIKFTSEYATHLSTVSTSKVSTEQIPFIMAPLNYGCIPDLTFLPSENHCMQKIGSMSLGNEFDDYYLKSSGHVQQFYMYSAKDLKLHFANTEAYLLPSITVSHAKSEENHAITSTLAPASTSTSTQPLHTNIIIANDQIQPNVKQKSRSIFTGNAIKTTSTLSTSMLWEKVMTTLSELGVNENMHRYIFTLALSIEHNYKLNKHDSEINTAELVSALKQVIDWNYNSSSSLSSNKSLFYFLLDELNGKFSQQSVNLVKKLLIDMHETCKKNLTNAYKLSS